MEVYPTSSAHRDALYADLDTTGGRGGGGGSVGGSRGGSSGGSSSGGRASGRTASSADKPPPYSQGAPPPPYSVSGGSVRRSPPLRSPSLTRLTDVLQAVRGNPGLAGGGTPYTIGAGNAFAGRAAGGGARSGIYGGRGYGGYGAVPFFPFMFWPLAFGGGYGYYYGSHIYGPPNNDTRPGGTLQTWTLLPTWGEGVSSSSSNGTTAPPTGNAFALYGDYNSVNDLIPALASNCSVSMNYGQNITADPFQVVQYYRGDSFSLLLNDYNNSLPLINIESEENFTLPDAQPAPLPSTVNQTYLECLNSTIGQYVGLIDADYVSESSAAMTRLASGSAVGSVALLAVIGHLLF